MTISELIHQLEDLKTKHGPETKVLCSLSGTFHFQAVDCDPPHPMTVLKENEITYGISFTTTPETETVIVI